MNKENCALKLVDEIILSVNNFIVQKKLKSFNIIHNFHVKSDAFSFEIGSSHKVCTVRRRTPVIFSVTFTEYKYFVTKFTAF